MPKQADKLTFEASAYLQTLIGRELFRSRELAIVELVKNSYDSGASLVTVRIELPTNKRPAAIEITDNGSGMDLPTLKKLFMVAGYSEKTNDSGEDSRIPTGEKGIGRFASDRLGSMLKVETKIAGQSEGIVIDIDWTAFDTRKKTFNEIQVPFYRRPLSFLRPGQSGTRLQITRLRDDPWTQTSLDRLRNVLSELFNPFDPPKDFEVNLDVVGADSKSGPVVGNPIVGPDFDLRFTVKAGGSLERTLKHTPVSSKEVRSIAGFIEGAESLVGMHGRFYYYLKRPKHADVGTRPPGVFLYRDGFRIEPFGSGAADWLGIGERRAKRAGHAHIVPTRLFGFVSISRQKHEGLRDTTSREALLDTPAARALVHVLKSDILVFLEEEIRKGIAEPRWEESRIRKTAELQRVRFEALNVMSSGVAHELRQPLQAIRSEAGNITKRLQQLRVDDSIVRNSQQSIDQSIERIDGKIQLISALSGSKLDVPSELDMTQVITEECRKFEQRAKEQKIHIQLQLPASHQAVVSDPLVRMIVWNLVANAVVALGEVTDGRDREVRVRLKKGAGAHVVSVQDNGNGIPEDVRGKLFTTFVTNTTGGMGVGLYICHLILKSHGGEISFQTKAGLGTTFTAQFAEQELSNDK